MSRSRRYRAGILTLLWLTYSFHFCAHVGYNNSPPDRGREKEEMKGISFLVKNKTYKLYIPLMAHMSIVRTQAQSHTQLQWRLEIVICSWKVLNPLKIWVGGFAIRKKKQVEWIDGQLSLQQWLTWDCWLVFCIWGWILLWPSVLEMKLLEKVSKSECIKLISW